MKNVDNLMLYFRKIFKSELTPSKPNPSSVG